MSRHAKGPRLYLARPRWRDGKLHQRFTWFIRDGKDKISTRVTATDRAEAECKRRLAEQKLAEHIGHKYKLNRERGRCPAEILVLDALNIYLDDVARSHARPEETKQRVLTLAEFFASDTLAISTANAAASTRPGAANKFARRASRSKRTARRCGSPRRRRGAN